MHNPNDLNNVYDASRPCPKCGNVGTNDEYIGTNSVIKRNCNRCRYWWLERTLDSIENIDK